MRQTSRFVALSAFGRTGDLAIGRSVEPPPAPVLPIRRRPLTPAERFGAELRRERERAGISLETIARRTNVSASHFVALERGDCSHWPPGVYSRAFLRGYAIAVGLHPEQVLAEAAQYFSNFHDEGLPITARCPEVKHELRLQLDVPGPDWNRRIQALAVAMLDVGIAVAAGGAAAFMGGSFWAVALLVLVLCYVAAQLRAPTPRSAFMLPAVKPPRYPRPAVPAEEATEEPFAEDPLGANSV